MNLGMFIDLDSTKFVSLTNLPPWWELSEFLAFTWCRNIRYPAICSVRKNMSSLRGFKPGWVVMGVYKRYNDNWSDPQHREATLDEFVTSLSEIYSASIGENYVIRLQVVKLLIEPR